MSAPFTEDWWATEAFSGAPDASAAERRATRSICERYGIRGVADPGYVANVLAHRSAPVGPTPIEPGLDSACRFLTRVYPVLADAQVADLVRLVEESLVEPGR